MILTSKVQITASIHIIICYSRLIIIVVDFGDAVCILTIYFSFIVVIYIHICIWSLNIIQMYCIFYFLCIHYSVSTP